MDCVLILWIVGSAETEFGGRGRWKAEDADAFLICSVDEQFNKGEENLQKAKE